MSKSKKKTESKVEPEKQQESKQPLSEEELQRIEAAMPSMDFSAESRLRELAETATSKDSSAGRKPKEVKDAQLALGWTKILVPTLSNLNRLVHAKVPEFAHDEDEIKQIAVLTSEVMAKHVSPGMEKYEQEVALAVYLGSSLIQKGEVFRQRKIMEAEQAERNREQEVKKRADKSAKKSSKKSAESEE